jgi:K+-transporting ATPase KdpF subunit
MQFCIVFKYTDVKTIILMAASLPNSSNQAFAYIIGALIAALLLGYLVYSLINPEKF